MKTERLLILQAAINRHAAAFNTSCVGRRFDVLLEKPGRHAGQITGRSPYLQPVQVMADVDQISSVVSVRMTGIQVNSLLGELVDTEPPALARSFDPALAEA